MTPEEGLIFQDNPDDDEIIPKNKFIAVTYGIIALNVGFLIFSVYIVYKIFRLVKFKDIPLLCSIFCITFALAFYLVYNILNQIRGYILSEKGWD
jgi:hypothetical protein